MVNRVRIHPIHWQSSRAIVLPDHEEDPVSRNGKNYRADGTYRGDPPKPLDLQELADDFMRWAGRIHAAGTRLESMAMDQQWALEQAATQAQFDELTTQLNDRDALISLVKESLQGVIDGGAPFIACMTLIDLLGMKPAQ